MFVSIGCFRDRIGWVLAAADHGQDRYLTFSIMEAVVAANTERGSMGEWTLRVLVVLLLGIFLLGVWHLRDVFLLVFFAAIMAIVLQIPVRMFQRIGLPRGVSIALSLIGAFALLAILLILLIPIFVNQVGDLIDILPERVDDVASNTTGWWPIRWLPEIEWHRRPNRHQRVPDRAGRYCRQMHFYGLSGVVPAWCSCSSSPCSCRRADQLPEGMLRYPAVCPRALRSSRNGPHAAALVCGQLISDDERRVDHLRDRRHSALRNAVEGGSPLDGVHPHFGSIIGIPALIIALATRPVLVPPDPGLCHHAGPEQPDHAAHHEPPDSLSAATILPAQIIGARCSASWDSLGATDHCVTVLVREIVYDAQRCPAGSKPI